MNNVSVSREFAVALRAQLRVLADKDPSIFGTGTSDDCAPWPIIEEFIHDLTQALAQPSEQPADDACPDDEEPCSDEDCQRAGMCIVKALAKAEQPGDVGLARKIALDLANFLFRSTGEKPFTGGIVVDVIESVISPHLAALSPSVPAEAVAWMYTRNGIRQASFSLAAAEVATQSGKPQPLYAAPPANDEAVRLIAECAEYLDSYGPGTSIGRDSLLHRKMKAVLASQQEEKG